VYITTIFQPYWPSSGVQGVGTKDKPIKVLYDVVKLKHSHVEMNSEVDALDDGHIGLHG
jgi:hypothetical protein